MVICSAYVIGHSDMGSGVWIVSSAVFLLFSIFFVLSDDGVISDIDKKTIDIQLRQQALDIIKEESENAGVRQYTCINQVGHSQFERNIAERILKLKKDV
jgi:hypothetical protein